LEKLMRDTRKRWLEVTHSTLLEMTSLGTAEDSHMTNLTSKFYMTYFKF